MADAVPSLGLDLREFERSLNAANASLSKGAERAIRASQRVVAEAAREAAQAQRLQAQAAADAARTQLEALRAQQREQARLAQEAQAAAQAQQAAAQKLAGLAAGRSEIERLTFAYSQQVEEIKKLVAAGGSQADGAKALVAVTQRHQAALTELKRKQEDSTKATERGAGASYALRQQAQSLQKNMLDLFQVLAAGQDPMTALSQQGPQIAEAFAQAGDTAGLLKQAFGGVAGAAGSLAPVLAAAAVGAAALAAAYAVVTNATQSMQGGLYDLRAQVEASRKAFEGSSAAANASAAGIRDIAAAARLAQEDLSVLVGTSDRYAVALGREVEAIDARRKADLQAVATQLAWGRTALANEQALLRNRDASVAERAEASRRVKVLEQVVRAQQEALDAAQAGVEAEKQAAAQAAEYRRELEESEAFLRKREEAQRVAAQAAQRQAEADRMAAAAAKELADATAKATAAAREWAMVEGTVAATAQELGRVSVELEGVVALIEKTAADQLAASIAEADRGVQAFGDSVRSLVVDQLRAAGKAAREVGGALAGAAGIDLSGGPMQALLSVTTDAVKAEQAAAAAVADARAELRAAVASGDTEAIAQAREGLRAARGELEAAQPTAFVKELINGATDMVTAIVDALPGVVKGLVGAAPRLITAIVDAIPQLVIALVRAAPQIAIDLATAFALELPIQLIAAAPKIAAGLAVGIGEGFVAAAARIKRVVGDIFKEIATGGRADTRTFGDTPGPVRVSSRGLDARFAPGDLVVAARTAEGLRAQTGARAGRRAATADRLELDFRDGPVRLGIARATRRAADQLGLGRDRTGRSSPYRMA